MERKIKKTEKDNYTKKLKVVRFKDNLNDEQKAKGYGSRVKVRTENPDRDGDVDVAHKWIASKIKFEKPGDYEVAIECMTVHFADGEVIKSEKIQDLVRK